MEPNLPILRLQEIHKWYNRHTARERHVLRGVSIDVARGEVVVLIGPSGSGKSTLLRCVNQLTPPDLGRIEFLGRDWSPVSPRPFDVLSQWRRDRALVELRTQIGMVFQHFNLFPHMTVLDNVTLGLTRVKKLPKKVARERAMEEVARVGLADWAQSYPGQLSGGQKQRVAIARSLAMEPQLMLLDEITSALDPELIGGILEEVKRLARSGMTMIVVTHEMTFAREVGDRVIFMDNGVIVEEGSARAILNSPQNPRTQTFLRALVQQGENVP